MFMEWDGLEDDVVGVMGIDRGRRPIMVGMVLLCEEFAEGIIRRRG
jgi:hypothetical protein